MEDINTYTFDFKKEAEALLSDLGERGRNTILMMVRVNEGDVSFPGIVGAPETIDKFFSRAAKAAKSEFSGEEYKSAFHSRLYDISEKSVASFIYLRENDRVFDSLGEQDRELMALSIMWHEKAHDLIDDGPDVDDNHPYAECAADAYAAIRLLQRFGPEATGFLSRLSWYRSFDAIEGTAHLTTTVLDKIIADSADTDFTKLTHEQTIEWAMAYAKTWTPMPDMLEKVHEFLKEEERIFDIPKICNGILPADKNPNDVVAYFGAKMLDPLAGKGMIINGQEVVYDSEYREEIAKATGVRLDGISLESIFNYFARRGTKSAQETLKVSLPPGGPWNIKV